jgi:DNA-binding NarL/FixJ family response regulator
MRPPQDPADSVETPRGAYRAGHWPDDPWLGAEFRDDSSSRPTRVVIVDDHRILREGLRTILDGERDIVVVGEAEDGFAGVQLTRALGPDVVVMDIRMPELNGTAATALIKREMPRVEVVVASAEVDATTIIDCMRGGAIGFVGKQSPPDELCQAVRAARLGQTYLASEAVGALMREMRALDQHERMTERELDVIRLVTHGETNVAIARKLHISETTVATHLSAIMLKLRVHNRIELVLRAHRLGLNEKRSATWAG